MKINLTVAFIVFFAINYNSNAIDVEQTNKRNMQGVYEFVKSCGHYFIATVEKGTSDTVTTGAITIIKEKDIQPRLRPFGTVAIFDGRLYIQTGKKKRVSLQMHDNPKIEICALNEQKNEWIRIEAVAVNDERLEAKKYMLEQYPELRRW